MSEQTVRTLWAEPPSPGATAPGWRDGLLSGALTLLAVLEGALRDDLVWPVLSVAVALVLPLALPWRRVRPVLVSAVVFGAIVAFDVAATRAGADPDRTLLWMTVVVLILPYCLLRWGSGRQIVVGSLVLLAVPFTSQGGTSTFGDVLLGLLLFGSSAAIGVALRYRANLRTREVDQVRLREREQLARELHDVVAHHVSAIAVQAQAGRAVAATDPDRAVDVLQVIEEAASRTLVEMRAVVGVLRDGTEADLAPQPGIGDIPKLADPTRSGPRIEVRLTGDLDGLGPPIGAALYRIAQESVTNARRHARGATLVEVHLAGDGETVRLTVHDDGRSVAGDRPSFGYGIVGMTERASLLGGRVTAGPGDDGGWTVDAELPRTGATA